MPKSIEEEFEDFIDSLVQPLPTMNAEEMGELSPCCRAYYYSSEGVVTKYCSACNRPYEPQVIN